MRSGCNSAASSVTVYVLSPREVSEACSSSNGGCYRSSGDLIVVRGPTVRGNIDRETVLAHGYAHHIANNRNNPPWDAAAWGPKRWATDMNVCRRVASHAAFPGAEDPKHYPLNPGEGWAGAYAFANGYQFSDVFYRSFPNKRAKALIKQDAIHPWAGDTTRTLMHTVGRGRTTRTNVSTPLDGTLHLRLNGPKGSVLQLKLSIGNTVVKTAKANSPNQRIDYPVCGNRQFAVVVSAIRGSGSYKLVMKRP